MNEMDPSGGGSTRRARIERETGETHVELGAKIMRVLFGSRWGDFCAAHSRYWAKARGVTISRLCVADKLAFVGNPPLFLPTVKQVHVSCTFTWDRPEAERLARAWSNQGYEVSTGGPAYGSPAGQFTPGMYVKCGMTITSRGCVRRRIPLQFHRADQPGGPDA